MNEFRFKKEFLKIYLPKIGKQRNKNPDRKNKNSLKATALFYSLLLSTLIGIMLTALVAIWVFYKSEHTKDFQLWNQLQLLEASFKWVSHQKDDFSLENIQLFDSQQDSLLVIKQTWGFFDLVGCQVANKEGTTQRVALMGKKSTIGSAMILAESRKPLALSGHSQIIGNAVVPLGGITTTTVNQKPFLSDRMVVGNIITGGGEIPELEENWINKITKPRNRIKQPLIEVPDSLRLSYFEFPYYIQDSVLDLKNKNWEGLIFLEADSLIRIGQNCSLKGIILKAPIIEIEAGFKGQIQAIATVDMTIGKKVQLLYPSVLAIREKTSIHTRRAPRLRIGEGSLIEGFILGLKAKNSDFHPSINIEKAHIIGRLLWDGAVEGSGKVEGGFFAQNFFYRGDGTRFYFNYMVDFIIDGPARSKHWVEPMIWARGEKAVALWLD